MGLLYLYFYLYLFIRSVRRVSIVISEFSSIRPSELKNSAPAGRIFLKFYNGGAGKELCRQSASFFKIH